MKTSRILACGLLALATVGSIACSKDNPQTTTAPVVNNPTTTESFSGTIQLGETSCHDFNLALEGDIRVTLRSIAPLATLTVGMSIGSVDPTAVNGCAIFGQDNSIRVNDTILSERLIVGPYCACVLDVGNIFPDETVEYEIDVTHT